MFLTESIPKIIFEVVTFARAKEDKTYFFKTVKHNFDLCPRYETQVDLIMQSLKEYQSIVYDIQGPRDCGTDIIIKLPRSDNETEHICFQIKSQDDLMSKDYLRILKAQYHDTKQKYNNLLDYYILLCCESYSNKNKIRTVASDFAKEKKVHIITPEYSLMFYHLSVIYIDSIIKAKIGSQDVIYRKSLELLIDLTPTEKAILFYLIWLKVFKNVSAIKQNDILNSSFISEIYNEVPDYDKDWFLISEVTELHEKISDGHNYEEDGMGHLEGKTFGLRGLSIRDRIAEDLNVLEDDFILQNNFGGYDLLYPTVYPLVVLLIDGHIRYEYVNDELLRYMMGLFAPMKGYNLI